MWAWVHLHGDVYCDVSSREISTEHLTLWHLADKDCGQIALYDIQNYLSSDKLVAYSFIHALTNMFTHHM